MSSFVNNRNPFIKKLNKISEENIYNLLGNKILPKQISKIVALLHNDKQNVSWSDYLQLSNVLVLLSEKLCEINHVPTNILNDSMIKYKKSLLRSFVNSIYGPLIGKVWGKLNKLIL